MVALKLIETIVCVAIVVILMAGFGGYTLGTKAYAQRAAVQGFAAFLDDASAVAKTSGTGATIAIASDTHGGFIATLYPYRPLDGADLNAGPLRTLRGGVTLTQVAIFISSSGTVSAAPWKTSDGSLVSEPACSTVISLTFGTEPHTIPCQRAVLL